MTMPEFSHYWCVVSVFVLFTSNFVRQLTPNLCEALRTGISVYPCVLLTNVMWTLCLRQTRKRKINTLEK